MVTEQLASVTFEKSKSGNIKCAESTGESAVRSNTSLHFATEMPLRLILTVAMHQLAPAGINFSWFVAEGVV